MFPHNARTPTPLPKKREARRISQRGYTIDKDRAGRGKERNAMGAHMLAIVLAEDTTTSAPRAPLSEDIRLLAGVTLADTVWLPAATAALADGREAELEEILDGVLGFTQSDTAEPTVENLTRLRPHIADLIFDALAFDPISAPRQWARWTLRDGLDLHITGGQSFGDVPTEAFQHWDALFRADIDDALYHALGYINADSKPG